MGSFRDQVWGFFRDRQQYWPERDEAAVRAQVYAYLEHAKYWHATKDGPELRPWEPTRFKMANVLDALRAVTHLDETVQPPAWLDGDGLDPHDLVVTANGILHVPTRRLPEVEVAIDELAQALLAITEESPDLITETPHP